MKFINSSLQLDTIMSRFVGNEVRVETCTNSSCNCFSHDKFYTVSGWETGPSVAERVKQKVVPAHKSGRGYGLSEWGHPPLERDLKDRGSLATSVARRVLEMGGNLQDIKDGIERLEIPDHVWGIKDREKRKAPRGLVSVGAAFGL